MTSSIAKGLVANDASTVYEREISVAANFNGRGEPCNKPFGNSSNMTKVEENYGVTSPNLTCFLFSLVETILSTYHMNKNRQWPEYAKKGN